MATAHNSANRFLLALAAVAALLLGFMSPAQAHDELIKAVPADKAELTTAPEEIVLTFSGNLTTGQGIPNVIMVRDESDENWADGEAEVDGRNISVPLKEDLPNGTYRVSYRVVYSDGHPEEQMYSFTLANPAAAASPTASEQPDTATTSAESEATEQATGSPEPASTTAEAAPAAENNNSSGMVAIWVGIAVAIAAGLGFFGISRRNKRNVNNP